MLALMPAAEHVARTTCSAASFATANGVVGEGASLSRTGARAGAPYTATELPKTTWRAPPPAARRIRSRAAPDETAAPRRDKGRRVAAFAGVRANQGHVHPRSDHSRQQM